MVGFIPIRRNFFVDIFNTKPFTPEVAMLYLLVNVSPIDEYRHIERVGKVFQPRGSLVVSNRYLADAFGWSLGAVIRWLKKCVNGGILMVGTQVDTQVDTQSGTEVDTHQKALISCITLLKYDDYVFTSSPKVSIVGTQVDTQVDTQSGTEVDTNYKEIIGRKEEESINNTVSISFFDFSFFSWLIGYLAKSKVPNPYDTAFTFVSKNIKREYSSREALKNHFENYASKYPAKSCKKAKFELLQLFLKVLYFPKISFSISVAMTTLSILVSTENDIDIIEDILFANKDNFFKLLFFFYGNKTFSIQYLVK